MLIFVFCSWDTWLMLLMSTVPVQASSLVPRENCHSASSVWSARLTWTWPQGECSRRSRKKLLSQTPPQIPCSSVWHTVTESKKLRHLRKCEDKKSRERALNYSLVNRTCSFNNFVCIYICFLFIYISLCVSLCVYSFCIFISTVPIWKKSTATSVNPAVVFECCNLASPAGRRGYLQNRAQKRDIILSPPRETLKPLCYVI